MSSIRICLQIPITTRTVARSLMAALAGISIASCDRFDASRAAPSPAPSARLNEAVEAARAPLTAAMKAAEGVTASCKAGDLFWEADPTDEGIAPKHFSRPCIPEVCATTAKDIDALRQSSAEAKKVIEAHRELDIPSYNGFIALTDAMVGFLDTGTAAAKSVDGAPAKTVPSLSGLSMHYASMAAAFRQLYPDSDVALEPPSLVASLAGTEPGGDVCKGWADPRLCDVRAVRLPKERRWRSDPACIEVESVKK